MRLLIKVVMVIFIGVICLSISGCNIAKNKEINEQLEKFQKEAEIELKIYDVLNNTQVDPMFAPTIGKMVVIVFHNFDITWEEYNCDTIYKVTISGNYCPNPDLPDLSMNGSITYLVDIKNDNCEVLYDHNNLTGTFLVFIFY